MSREDIREIKQRMQGIEMVLGQLRIDQKTMLEEQSKNFIEGNNSIIELKVGINNINIKLDKHVIPGTTSITMITTVIENIEKGLENITSLIKKNTEILDNLEVDATKKDEQESSVEQTKSTHNEQKLQEKIDSIVIALNNIYLKEDDILLKITTTNHNLNQKIETIAIPTTSTNLDLLTDLREIKRLQEDLTITLGKEKFPDKLNEIWNAEQQILTKIDISTTQILNNIGTKPNIPTQHNTTDLGPKLLDYLNKNHNITKNILLDLSSELRKHTTQLITIEENTGYLKEQEPEDNSLINKKLDEITLAVQTIDLTAIRKQISQLFEEATGQQSFTEQLVKAIKLGIYDRLTRIEENLYKFVTHYKPSTTTYATTIGQTTKVTETVYVHIDGHAPDKAHFIQ